MFVTLDIYKAAFLSMCGLPHVTKYKKDKLMFMFEDEHKAESLLNDYLSFQVGAGLFAQEVKKMRSLIYKKREEGVVKVVKKPKTTINAGYVSKKEKQNGNSKN